MFRMVCTCALAVGLSFVPLGCGGGGGGHGAGSGGDSGDPADPGGGSATGEDATQGDTQGGGGTGDGGVTLTGVVSPLCDDFSAPKTGQRQDGLMQKIALTDYPDALCNDGTPASVYVREATNPDHAGRFIVYFKGGSQCLYWGSCIDRWCEETSLMTSLGHAPSKHRDGMLNPDLAGNAFGGWNHVYVPYCTSDMHSGTGDSSWMEDPAGEGPSFTMHFKGHHVFQAVMDLLEAGATSDDGTEVLAPLGEADLVLVAGSSAGAGSVALNLDRFAARFPTLDVRGVIDSHGAPQPEHFPEEGSGAAKTFGVDYLEDSYFNSYTPLWGQVVDESCRAANPVGSDTAWLCGNTGYVQMNHITTPFFARYDLLDGNLGGPYFLPQPDGAGANHQAFSTGCVAWLEDISRADEDGVEAADMTVKPGVFGPRCRHHTSLGSDAFFIKDFIEDGGEMSSFHDALIDWLGGAEVKWIDPPGEGKFPGCPVEDD